MSKTDAQNGFDSIKVQYSVSINVQFIVVRVSSIKF